MSTYNRFSVMKSRLLRTKSIEQAIESEKMPLTSSRFKRCLTTIDLISLGVGSCVGTGMYVVAGLVANDMAGPGVLFSFLIAALASLFSGVCYAEFGVRVPKTTGSAYMYSYVTVGEFFAFVIGWNLILEYIIGTAAGASALSSCFDSLTRHSISDFMVKVGGVDHRGNAFPDLLAFVIVIAMTLMLAAGVRKSVFFNNVLNVVNAIVWVFVIAAGLFYVNTDTWTENGGFLPYGTAGIFNGAATCFYAFIGFDIIATTGEESQNPGRSIPIAIVCTLVICLVAYESISIVLTMSVPYFDIDPESAVTDLFAFHGSETGKYIVAVGAIAALTASLLGSQFPMSRVIYAMANDGLLFKYFASINTYTNTPVVATMVSGFTAALLALLIGLQDLVEMMSIGTLLAYTLVTISVLVLRYQPDKHQQLDEISPIREEDELELDGGGDGGESKLGTSNIYSMADDEHLISEKPIRTSFLSRLGCGGACSNVCNTIQSGWMWLRLKLGFPDPSRIATVESGLMVKYIVVLLSLTFLVFHLLLVFGQRFLVSGEWWAIILMVIFGAVILAGTYVLLRQPQNPRKLRFMVPCLPILPVVGVFVNIYLILRLNYLTWIRFGVWMAVGFIIYFAYGLWNSKKEQQMQDPTADEKDASSTPLAAQEAARKHMSHDIGKVSREIANIVEQDAVDRKRLVDDDYLDKP